ncbi:MAG: glycosyltransferase family 2 protein [Desulfobaccales bacterium]
MNNKPVLAIVVPCYNEEEVLPETINRLSRLMQELVVAEKISEKSFLLFVDDGSRDRTWGVISEAHRVGGKIRGLKLSRNFGHQNALVAGMEHVRDKCDCMVSIDADLQDDINVIEVGLEKYYSGANIVYFVRRERKKDTWLKKSTAYFFYRLISFIGVGIIYNHADYRLIDRTVLNCFLSYKEVNMFLRGIFPMIGFTIATVPYDRKERFAGKSKYPFKKMMAFALEGITSFSVVPLRIVSAAGLAVFSFSLLMGGFILYYALVRGKVVPGWASTVLPIYFLGGVQLLSLGIIGEYIGKIYNETKGRPRYFVETSAE